jgi:hypothetical protein
LQETQQFLSAAFDALITSEATEFQVVIFKNIDLQSLADQRDREPDRIGPGPFDKKTKTSTIEQTHGGKER